jgi:ATP-dependent RNA helicase DDX24/MAK5
MGKKSKSNHINKASAWAALPWTKMQVGKDKDNDDDDDEDFLAGDNHYDNPNADASDLYGDYGADKHTRNDQNSKTKSKTSLKRKKFSLGQDADDFIEGADDPGIFVGLEVIDGSMYSVEKIVDSQGGYITRLNMDMKNNVNDNQNSKNKTKKNKKSQETETENENRSTNINIDTPATNKDDDNLQSSVTNTNTNNGKNETISRKNKKQKLSKPQTSKLLKQDNNQEQEVQQQKSSTTLDVTTTTTTNNMTDSTIESNIENVQNSWAIDTGGVYFHENITKNLTTLGFIHPTPIQASTLAASILGKRDIVGAAPTGSGKTLSYLLPILQFLFEQRDELHQLENDEAKNDNNNNISHNHFKLPLTALIMTPTRELALQVSKEFSKLVAKSSTTTGTSSSHQYFQCATIVGGLAEQKQKRILNKQRPPVIVATPGRLWELMSNGEHEHLSNLSKLRFLVIDEADRMISQGNFPQLTKICEQIVKANPPPIENSKDDESDSNNDIDDDDDDSQDRLQKLPGIMGESKVKMLTDDILRMIEMQKTSSDLLNPTDMQRLCDEEDSIISEDQDLVDDSEESDSEEIHTTTRVQRQTFIFSATLTLPPIDNSQNDVSQKKRKNKSKKNQTVDGAIAEILEKAGAEGQMKIVDLSTSSWDRKNGINPTQTTSTASIIANSESITNKTVKLPPGLSLYQILCTQKHKDSHLYAYLTTTKQGSSGPCLVFCNSIAATNRVGETLKVLGLDARVLHANMPQKARFSALESLKEGKKGRSIVIATDVAARGLDIPSVSTVIHYDIPRKVDTFVHRSGRTARGVGEKAVGCSISLVSANEEKNHAMICRAVNPDSKGFETANIDGRLLSAASDRVLLASKIVVFDDKQSKSNKNNKWFTEAADAAGFDLDDDMLDNELPEGGFKKKNGFNKIEVRRAREELKVLLAKPMRIQSYGKFLSGAGLQDAIKAENEVKPTIVASQQMKKNKKKKRRNKA